MYESKPYFYGTGRRKKSVARVRVYPGTGKITINDRDIDDYFGLETLKLIVRQPLALTETSEKYDVENSFVLHDSIFDNDALIIENSGVTEVTLIDKGKRGVQNTLLRAYERHNFATCIEFYTVLSAIPRRKRLTKLY